MISERGLMMTYLVSHPRMSYFACTRYACNRVDYGDLAKSDGFLRYPTMEAIATARGVELEVAKAQASTMQERV